MRWRISVSNISRRIRPRARGGSERLFHILQDRVPNELALAGITTMTDANHGCAGTYIPAHDARFARRAEHEGSAFVAVPGLDPAEVLSVQDERIVGNDLVKATVKVHQYPDDGLVIFGAVLRRTKQERAATSGAAC